MPDDERRPNVFQRGAQTLQEAGRNILQNPNIQALNPFSEHNIIGQGIRQVGEAAANIPGQLQEEWQEIQSRGGLGRVIAEDVRNIPTHLREQQAARTTAAQEAQISRYQEIIDRLGDKDPDDLTEAERAQLTDARERLAVVQQRQQAATPSTGGGQVTMPNRGGGTQNEPFTVNANEEALTERAMLAQEAMAESGAIRSNQTIQDTLENTGMDTSRTPEMIRAERYQRLADQLNNRQWWDQGVMGGVNFMTGGLQGYEAAAAFQAPQMEFQETRENLINLSRQGDRLAYEQLGRFQAAHDVGRRIRENMELNQNDIEKIRVVHPEEARQAMTISEVQLWSAMRHVESNIEYHRALQDAAAALQISEDKMLAVLLSMVNGNWEAGYMRASLVGMNVPAPTASMAAEMMMDLTGARQRRAQLIQQGGGNSPGPARPNWQTGG